MNELLPLINRIYRDILSNGLHNYLDNLKELLSAIILLYQTENFTPSSYVKILELLNIIGTYNIQDEDLNLFILNTRLCLIKYKMDEKEKEDIGLTPYTKKMSKVLNKMELI